MTEGVLRWIVEDLAKLSLKCYARLHLSCKRVSCEIESYCLVFCNESKFFPLSLLFCVQYLLECTRPLYKSTTPSIIVWLVISYKSRLPLVIRMKTLNSATNVICVNMGHECSWYTLFCNLCTYQSINMRSSTIMQLC